MGYEQIAAVDLGSNSFRLEVGRVVDHQIYPLDTVKESVRLAAGLTAEKRLDEAAQQRGLEALSRFGERLRGFAPDAVRAVATNTLRVAKNAGDFIRKAEATLGFPIEVIAGREEARLIYVGAAHALPAAPHRRLVVDIGGGSTEFIIGKRHDPQLMESLFMGCVSYSLRFFPDGKISRKRFQEAEVAAARELESITHDFRAMGWHEAVASSGTARTIAVLLELNGFNPGGETGITRSGLAALRENAIRGGLPKLSGMAGLRLDRLPVLPGGIAILSAVFSSLGIERMIYSEGALRLGVLYDLLGRSHHQDMREATVLAFMRRYQVDAKQVRRVERTALALLGQRVALDRLENEHTVQLMRWSVALHEIGLSIAHGAYHKHGAYIVGNADMPGFSRNEQQDLARLILGQRGKLEKVSPAPVGDMAWELMICLRLAVLLNRSRDDSADLSIRLSQTRTGFQIEFDADWLDANPLTRAALADEVAIWSRVGQTLQVRRRQPARGAE